MTKFIYYAMFCVNIHPNHFNQVDQWFPTFYDRDPNIC